MRHGTGGSPLHFFFGFFFRPRDRRGIFSDVEQACFPGKGSVGGGEAGEKAKMTLDTGGKSVSEKSQTTPGLQEPLLEIKK
jgi:hypothetical protein